MTPSDPEDADGVELVGAEDAQGYDTPMHSDEPPVIARMVVEIRSDGSRTIARGAMEDHIQGERVQVEARADSPLQLATALAKLLFESPRLARRALDQSRGEATPVESEGRARGLRGKVGRAVARRLWGKRD